VLRIRGPPDELEGASTLVVFSATQGACWVSRPPFFNALLAKSVIAGQYTLYGVVKADTARVQL